MIKNIVGFIEQEPTGVWVAEKLTNSHAHSMFYMGPCLEKWTSADLALVGVVMRAMKRH